MINRILAGVSIVAVICFGAVSSQAGLPTVDFANIGQSTTVVKNGLENLGGIKSITSQVSELNTIVGDAAGTISKYKDKYGEDIEKAQQMVKDAKERATSAVAKLNEYKAEVEERTSEYQSALDTVSKETKSAFDKVSEARAALDEAAKETKGVIDTVSDETKGVLDKVNEAQSALDTVSKEAKGVLDKVDDATGGEEKPEDVYDESYEKWDYETEADSAEKALSARKDINSNEMSYDDTVGEVAKDVGQAPMAAANPAIAARPMIAPAVVRRGDSVAIEEGGNLKGVLTREANPKPAVVKQQLQVAPSVQPFRVSPVKNMSQPAKIMRDSNSRYLNHETIAFAVQSSNPYVNNTYVLPMATRCKISAEDAVKDKDKMNECIAQIIKENSATNQFEAANAVKDCKKMVYDTVKALLAEAINAKYEAANYQQVLDKQDEVAAGSVDVRNDNHVIAAAFQQGQILLNRSSAVLSSQLLLETVQQLCSMQDDVLEGKDETANGVK